MNYTPNGPIEDWMIFLPPEQRSIASRIHKGPALVYGGTGTGKTVVGLHWAAARAKRNRSDEELFPEEGPKLPVLFTTYISSLPPVLKGLYHRLPDTYKDEVEFTNIDKLALKLCKQSPENTGVLTSPIKESKVKLAFEEAYQEVLLKNPSLANTKLSSDYFQEEVTAVIKGYAIESRKDYLDLPSRTGRRVPFSKARREQVWELKEIWDKRMQHYGTVDFCDRIVSALKYARKLDTPLFSAAVVDEVQDLTPAGLMLLQTLVDVPDKADRLLILGDRAQRIYPGGFYLRQAGIVVRGRTTVLTRNYRNTKQIIDVAVNVCKENF